ncbi:MAG: hypothetical protein CMP51_03415 [Flavobacteriales bacterium]|nr:hypothetical protein [Flavobacteriales bacterium]
MQTTKINIQNKDYLIVLAWPEGMTTAAGAWYDFIASKNGKYRVGHAALAIINSDNGKVHYFDFGRYHTPIGYGRVRDHYTDPDTDIKTKAVISKKNIQNIDEILIEVSLKKSYHAKGALYASVLSKINFKSAYAEAKKYQSIGAIPYGPFVINGTNCSRFVAKVCINAGISIWKQLRFMFPYTISPSPKRNISIANNNYYLIRKKKCIKIKRNFVKAYFSGIEIRNEET